MQAVRKYSAGELITSSIADELYLAFIDQQIQEVLNRICILREALIQVVADEPDTKQQMEALLSLLQEMTFLKSIRKDCL